MRLRKKLLLSVLVISVISLLVCFFKDKKKAEKRLADYTVRANTINTSYGKLSYIDEGE